MLQGEHAATLQSNLENRDYSQNDNMDPEGVKTDQQMLTMKPTLQVLLHKQST
jgi:hypothetical protein